METEQLAQGLQSQVRGRAGYGFRACALAPTVSLDTLKEYSQGKVTAYGLPLVNIEICSFK